MLNMLMIDHLDRNRNRLLHPSAIQNDSASFSFYMSCHEKKTKLKRAAVIYHHYTNKGFMPTIKRWEKTSRFGLFYG